VDGGSVKLGAVEEEDVAAFENVGHFGPAREGWVWWKADVRSHYSRTRTG
jgi:hypothetical protein